LFDNLEELDPTLVVSLPVRNVGSVADEVFLTRSELGGVVGGEESGAVNAPGEREGFSVERKREWGREEKTYQNCCLTCSLVCPPSIINAVLIPSAIPIPAVPAPKTTIRASFNSLFVTLTAEIKAARTTAAVPCMSSLKQDCLERYFCRRREALATPKSSKWRKELRRGE
jgi:hypothetical protein